MLIILDITINCEQNPPNPANNQYIKCVGVASRNENRSNAVGYWWGGWVLFMISGVTPYRSHKPTPTNLLNLPEVIASLSKYPAKAISLNHRASIII